MSFGSSFIGHESVGVQAGGRTDADATTATHARGTARRSTVPFITLAALLACVGYVAYQRLGTVAHADVIEYTPNLAGGFLAVGMTDQDPGFIVLSALERKNVEVDALSYGNRLAGDFTVAQVRTPGSSQRVRLRRPVVMLVHTDGAVEAFPVDWSFDDFAMIHSGVDCAHGGNDKRHRCGTPFAALFDVVSARRLPRVPNAVRRFLAPYARPQERAIEHSG